VNNNDGGPAFPFGDVSETTGQPINGFFNPGMSLRDYFAGQALIGILASPNCEGKVSECTAGAYQLAESMLKIRSTPTKHAPNP
jgi:hypothetical protein